MIGWLDVVYALVMGVFAGAVAIIATVAIERFGGIVGGVISSSPTTIIATAVGVAYVTQSTRSVTDAMFTIPTGMLIDVLVLLVWRQAPSVLPQEWSLTSKLASVVVASLLGWFALVCLVVFGVGHHAREHVSTIILGSVTAGIMLLVGLLTVFLQPLPAPKGVYSVSVGMHAARGLLAGSAIFVSGLLAKIDPIAAGFAASFPAIFTTTMVSMWISQGTAVGAGAAGPMMLGSQSVNWFAITFSFLWHRVGIVLAVVISYVSALCVCSIPTALLLNWLKKKHPELADEEAELEQMLPLDKELIDSSSAAYDKRL